ncbi:MAG: tRNA pseudouridine(55) synthase TruB [Coriobacteriales bacterium]|jgi:tRNA pseudouridine55 synthase|nr:tRNA pseudouridine(55) synthase TruB [Coriobacteriales bacterium]
MAISRRGATTLDGVLLVDKPVGMTSHDVVDYLRKLTGEGRIGHAGTLDPAATGLLIVCIGPATRLSDHLMAYDKEYLARIAFGQSTTTDDTEGTITRTLVPPEIIADPEYAMSVLSGLVGSIMQIPPQYSAIKQAGKTAYKQARQGHQVNLEPRQVSIYKLDLLNCSANSWDIIAIVSKGTYIRALARDIGELVGCPAHLAGLRRLAIGPWHVSQAYTLEMLKQASDNDAISSCFIKVDDKPRGIIRKRG